MLKDNKLEHLVRKYRENRLAHAYLIETNNQEACLKDLLEVIKIISCSNDYSSNCDKCNICNLINLNNLPTLKIIEPDGNNIKKQQIYELKECFSTKPVYTDYNIYVIKNADKLNSASANTMLKFLEEPDGQVLGFFITNNKDNIILTIQSRCQIIKSDYDNEHSLKSLEYTGDDSDILSLINEYLKPIEEKNKIALLNNKKLVISELLTIIDLDKLFKIILDIYTNALYYKREISNNFMSCTDFNYILDNDEIILLKKINLIISVIDNLNYNLNTELMLDKFVIEMSGIYE